MRAHLALGLCGGSSSYLRVFARRTSGVGGAPLQRAIYWQVVQIKMLRKYCIDYIGFGVYDENTSSILCISPKDLSQDEPGFNFFTQSTFDPTLDPKPVFKLQYDKANPAIVVIHNDNDETIRWESKSSPYGGFSGKRYENQHHVPLLKDGLHFFILSQTMNSALEQDNYGFCMMMNGKIPFHWCKYPNLRFHNKSITFHSKDPIYKATVSTMSCSKK